MLLSGRYEVVARNSLLAIGESYVAGLNNATHAHAQARLGYTHTLNARRRDVDWWVMHPETR